MAARRRRCLLARGRLHRDLSRRIPGCEGHAPPVPPVFEPGWYSQPRVGDHTRLGYQLDKAAVRRTVDFYLARTTHGSTLSRPVCAWLLVRADRTRPWSMLNEALDSDLADIQRGTTREGIHLGAMAGTVDLLLRCYTGLETREGKLWLHPTLPTELGQVRLQISYRNHEILVDLTPTTMVLHLQARAVPPIRVCVDDKTTTMHAGDTYRFTLGTSGSASR